jgi:cytochrome b561
MNSPAPAARPASKGSPARRIAAAATLGGLVFAVLWIMVFGMVTSLLIGAGCSVVIVAASSASDLFEMLLDAVATVVFGVLAAIAAIVAAIFSVFGF